MRAECSVCGEQQPLALIASLYGTDVCDDCIIQVFQLAIDDESNYPPRWGRHVLYIQNFQLTVPDDVRREFERRAKEWEVPPADRMYCQSPRPDLASGICGVFLGERRSDRVIQGCRHCGTRSCLCCGEANATAVSHHCDATRVRPSNDDDVAFGDFVRGRDYQRCPSRRCGRRIALADGCNHIECLCRTQFCYICGSEATAGSGHWRPQDRGCPRYNQPGSRHALFDPEWEGLQDIDPLMEDLHRADLADMVRHHNELAANMNRFAATVAPRWAAINDLHEHESQVMLERHALENRPIFRASNVAPPPSTWTTGLETETLAPRRHRPDFAASHRGDEMARDDTWRAAAQGVRRHRRAVEMSMDPHSTADRGSLLSDWTTEATAASRDTGSRRFRLGEGPSLRDIHFPGRRRTASGDERERSRSAHPRRAPLETMLNSGAIAPSPTGGRAPVSSPAPAESRVAPERRTLRGALVAGFPPSPMGAGAWASGPASAEPRLGPEMRTLSDARFPPPPTSPGFPIIVSTLRAAARGSPERRAANASSFDTYPSLPTATRAPARGFTPRAQPRVGSGIHAPAGRTQIDFATHRTNLRALAAGNTELDDAIRNIATRDTLEFEEARQRVAAAGPMPAPNQHDIAPFSPMGPRGRWRTAAMVEERAENDDEDIAGDHEVDDPFSDTRLAEINAAFADRGT